MKFIKPLDVLIILLLTVTVVFDYFPNSTFALMIPAKYLIWVIIGLFIFSLLFKRYRNTEATDIFKWQVFATVYFILLLGVLTMIGGESETGISFNSGFLWIVILISIVEMRAQWRRIKQNENAQKIN